MIGKGISFVQYKRIVAQLNRTQKELQQALDTMVTCTELSVERRSYLLSKIEVCESRLKNLRIQVEGIGKVA